MSQPSPLTLLTAAAAADPWNFYQARLSQSGLHFDPELQLWWAGEAHTVRTLMADARLGVRPPGQPVPPALQGRPFGRLFSQWLRMRDDADHGRDKQALQDVLQSWPASLLRQTTQACSTVAAGGGLRHWQWASLPCTVAAMLGLPMHTLPLQMRLLNALAGLAQALRPGAEQKALDAADAACEDLGAVLPPQHIALLWQAYEAGAALLGQAWLDRRGSESLRREGPRSAPVHHTRRWTREPIRFGDQALPSGSPVLLLLLGEPDLAWGHGPHRCPGKDLALAMAAQALQHAPAVERDTRTLGFCSLPNARVPAL